MLLALTRINDQGRNTRKRISREDAIYAAGKGDDKLGEQVLQMLPGARPSDANTRKPEGYWPTLYQYIAANPDREILRQQLNFKAK